MTEPTNINATPAPAAPASAPAPSAPAPSSATDSVTSAAPAPAAVTPGPVAPAAAPGASAPATAPVVEAPKAPAAEAPKDTSVLGGEVPKTEPPKAAEPPKPADGETTAEAPKAPEGEKKDAVAEVPLPTYEPFTLPEGVQADQEGMTGLAKILGGFQNTTKAPQAEVQKFGQQLVDIQVQRETALVERIQKSNLDFFNKQRNDWKTAFENDAEIGGDKKEATALSAKYAVREGASRSADQKINDAQTNELLGVLDATGMGNHPALIRTFANLHNIIKELRDKYEKEDSEPLSGRPAKEKQDRYSKFYGNTAS